MPLRFEISNEIMWNSSPRRVGVKWGQFRRWSCGWGFVQTSSCHSLPDGGRNKDKKMHNAENQAKRRRCKESLENWSYFRMWENGKILGNLSSVDIHKLKKMPKKWKRQYIKISIDAMLIDKFQKIVSHKNQLKWTSSKFHSLSVYTCTTVWHQKLTERR